MRYAIGKDQEDWLTLDEIREIVPSGKWRHNRIFEDVTVAVAMGQDPVTEFWPLDNKSKAWLIAWHRVKSSMAAYDQYLHDEEMKRQSRRRGRGPGNRP